MVATERLTELALASIAALDPANRVEAALVGFAGDAVDVLALGKAADSMTAGARRALGDRIASVTCAGPRQGSHPIPDERSVRAGRALLAAASSAGGRVLALVSGGGSALAAVPAAGLTLADKQRATSELLARGAPIGAINTVRKHLSAIKGGQLAARSPSSVQTLIISDVVSGDLASVASGPTLADPTTRADAAAVIERYSLDPSLVSRLVETPSVIAGSHSCIADNRELVRIAAELAGGSEIAEPLVGGIDSVITDLAALGPGFWIGGGEPTIVLPRDAGRGGRMTQLALTLARDFAGENFAAVCIGSDGVDGNSGAAGAAVDGSTWSSIKDGEAALANADSAAALDQVGALIITGPTGTNVADLVLLSLA